jgi:ribosomal protein S12 methylthiotransferase
MKGRVYLHPAACPKAGVDLEKIGWILEQAGFELSDKPAGSALGIVFGCGFIDDAKRESIEDILALIELKQRLELDHIVVVGCLPQKYGRSLALSLPEADAFVGVGALKMLPMICDRILDGKLPAKVWTDDLTILGDLRDTCRRIVPAEKPWTRTVMICDGCDNACSYCAIPQMRGPLRSRENAAIAAEVAELVRQGAKEIVLAGQDTASFGNDRGENGLARLLEGLAAQVPDIWLRLAYVNPDNLDRRVGDTIAGHANICNYMDLPIQHASPSILAAMGRKAPAVKRRVIADLREVVPDVALRTSVIVGFPGETEEDMDVLLEFLEAVEFDMVGVFAFSPQADTPAARLPGRVPDQVIQERIVDVLSLQTEISCRKMEAMLGRQVAVLVDELSGECSLAHSCYDMAVIDRTVRIAGPMLPPGQFAVVRLEKVSAPFEWTAIRC